MVDDEQANALALAQRQGAQSAGAPVLVVGLDGRHLDLDKGTHWRLRGRLDCRSRSVRDTSSGTVADRKRTIPAGYGAFAWKFTFVM